MGQCASHDERVFVLVARFGYRVKMLRSSVLFLGAWGKKAGLVVCKCNKVRLPEPLKSKNLNINGFTT